MVLDFVAVREQAEQSWTNLSSSKTPVIYVGTATCGRSAGALDTLKVLREKIAAQNMTCTFVEVGCVGLCYAEPLITVQMPDGPTVCFEGVDERKAEKIVESLLVEGDVPMEFAIGTLGEHPVDLLPNLFETPMLKGQVRRVLKNCGVIDPSSLDHCLAQGGYGGLERALKVGREAVVEELKESGLRGRGGAGFPVWRKWQFCIEADGDPKYIICNADEGDPGAFMNRSLLEGDPHAVLEGMLIAGFAIGASVGYIYCRAEYPLALERLRVAIEQAESIGLLGENALGSGQPFRIFIKEGAGAFVCGEETALIASIEGERGMPRPRPPFPAVSGLWGKPTAINNVETLASVARILGASAEWFAEYGTERSKGTKTFALVGNVQRTGLIEVPLGTSLRKIIFDIGGGPLEGRTFKAVQTGGPSGGCVPESKLDIPVDYESLQEAGTIMGSGGMVVMDECTCMVDFARYFLEFACEESCGACGPCRLGTRELLRTLEDITQGRATTEVMEFLEELGGNIKRGSLCGLGQTAPNPVLTTLRYFREEVVAHIQTRTCPAKSCRDYIAYEIDPEKCNGCSLCALECPADSIAGERKSPFRIDKGACIKCGLCADVCNFDAVQVVDAIAPIPGEGES